MRGDPNFRDNLLGELRNSRQWLDRLVVASFALTAGLVIVLFTFLADIASELFLDLQDAWARRFGGRPRLPVTGLFRVGTLDPAAEQDGVGAFQRSLARALRDPEGAAASAAKLLHMEPDLVREAGRRLTLEYVPLRAASPELRRFFALLSRHAPESLPPGAPDLLGLP